jgi:transposase
LSNARADAWNAAAGAQERAKHPGRQQLPAGLPREEQIIACTLDQCVCSKCGKETIVIGYETSEQLDVEPAKYFVRVTKREKRACKACEEQGVQCAPLPARIIDKGLASDRVIIDTVLSKYADHVPIYRQSAILERETGIELSRATMDGWVMRVGELLSPIVAAMGRELRVIVTFYDSKRHRRCWSRSKGRTKRLGCRRCPAAPWPRAAITP